MKYIQSGFSLIELMIVVAIISVLAAIAIPAYGDYAARAQSSEAFVLMDAIKTPLAELYTTNGTFGFDPSGTNGVDATTFGHYVSSIDTDTAGGHPFSVVATFKTTQISSAIAGKSVHFYYNPVSGSWTCANGNAAADDTTAINAVDPITPVPASSAVAQVPANTSLLPRSIMPKSCLN